MSNTGNESKKHIVLLGASIGRTWDFTELPRRVGADRFTFEYVGEYRYDKSEKLAGILARGENRPDAVIIKECATYFPESLDTLKTLIPQWVDSCRAAGVTPVLATVVPVVWSYPLRIFVYNLLHGKFGYPKGTFAAIITFNNWIHEYAGREGLVVLDLEAATRATPSDRHLNFWYARRDGLHLNERAYRELDKIVLPTLSRVDFSR